MISKHLSVILPSPRQLSIDTIVKYEKAKSAKKTQEKIAFFLIKLN